MSANRQKVFDDPLSMFGPPSSGKNDDEEVAPKPAPVKKAEPAPVAKPVVKPVVVEEPLAAPVVKKSSILDEPSPAGKKSSLFNDYSSTTKKSSIFDDEPGSSSPTPAAPVVVPVASPTEASKPESIFREIDVSKVTLKEKKKKTVEEASFGQVSQAEKGLGFTTDLWSKNDLLSGTTKPNKDIDDIFAGSTTKTKDYTLDDSLFGEYDPKKHVAKKEDDVSKLRMGAAGGDVPKSINIRGTKNDEEEATLADLNVAKLLEREEDLDFDTFGKVKMDNNVHITKTIKKNKDVFDLGSEDYLNELEAVTNKKDTTSTSKSSGPKVVQVQAAKEIDMSSLDLDAYISQQQASSGGGLFD